MEFVAIANLVRSPDPRPPPMNAEIQLSRDPKIERRLRWNLGHRRHWFVLRYIESQFGVTIRTEQSGATFEKIIDWCAQNGGEFEQIKRFVLKLFSRFFLDLPSNVQQNFEHIAEEIGFNIQKARAAKEEWLIGRWLSRALDFGRRKR
jgi:hypothetical protein